MLSVEKKTGASTKGIQLNNKEKFNVQIPDKFIEFVCVFSNWLAKIEI